MFRFEGHGREYIHGWRLVAGLAVRPKGKLYVRLERRGITYVESGFSRTS
jgi:hypothetical protein